MREEKAHTNTSHKPMREQNKPVYPFPFMALSTRKAQSQEAKGSQSTTSTDNGSVQLCVQKSADDDRQGQD